MSTSVQSVREPRGHDGDLSKLERVWERSQALVSITRSRHIDFDPLAGMTYSPVHYDSRSISRGEQAVVDDLWVAREFARFVRGEFGERQDPGIPDAWPPRIVDAGNLDQGYLSRFLAASERLVYSKPIDDPGDTSDAIAGAVFDFLCDPLVGSRKNRDNNDRTEFVTRLAPQMTSQGRLMFVLPGFPFKDQNHFRTFASPDAADLGEVAFMVRLHLLTQALFQFHPFGADMVILSDGDLYADLFGVETPEAARYFDRMIGYRNSLNLQGTISFLRLSEVIERGAPDAGVLRADIEERLTRIVRSDTSYGELTNTLIRAMKWNMNSQRLADRFGSRATWQLLRAERRDVSLRLRNHWDRLHAEATRVAISYAATNLMLRKTDLIQTTFPDSIRATVHPKPGQFSLARAGGAYPWNGVGWALELPGDVSQVQTRSLVELSNRVELQLFTVGPDRVPLVLTGGA